MPDLPWYIWALLAAVFASSSAILEKKLLTKEKATQYAASLALMSALVSLPVLPFIGWEDITPKLLIWIYVASILGSTAFLFVARAVRHIELGEVTIFLLANPAIVAVLAYLVLDESLSRGRVFGLCLVLLGMMILEWEKIRAFIRSAGDNRKMRYTLFAIGAVFLYAVGSLSDRFVLKTYSISALEYTVLMQIGIAINLAIFSRFHYGGFRQMHEGVVEHWKELGVLSLVLSLGRVFYGMAMQVAYVALAAAVKRSASAIFTTTASHFLLGEDHYARKMSAVLVMVVGILFLTL